MRNRPRNAKHDDAPRGVRRHPSGVWAIRFTCGARHLHKEKVGPLKQDAIRAYHVRRARAHAEPGWCPRVERHQAERAALQRVTFRAYAADYLAWALVNKRSGWKERSLVTRLVTELGDRPLAAISTADVEGVRDRLLPGRTGATVNRYRDLLSAMFKRAKRLGLVPANPVTGIPKFREAGQRLVWLHPQDEPVLLSVLPERLRPAVMIAQHMGYRWGEQAGIRWRDVDLLTGFVTTEPAKGQRRSVPINADARAVLMDLSLRRAIPHDPDARVFPLSHRQSLELLTRAVARAQDVIRDGGGDASRLDGFTWHSLRHTFASRLVMQGVDLRSVQELGGWKTLSQLQRYSHLSPGHLQAAVERLVGVGEVSRKWLEGAAVDAPARHREVLSPRQD
jgi:integrase